MGNAKALAFGRSETQNAMARYGYLLTNDETTLRTAIGQAINFFEALLKQHRPKPPFEGRRLSQIAPNKRPLIAQPTYFVSPADGQERWFSCESLIHAVPIRTLFTSRCITIIRFTEREPDVIHDRLIALVTSRTDPSWYFGELRGKFPKTLKSMRTNKKFYGMSLSGDEPPITGPKKKPRYAWVRTDVLYEATRLFAGDVHVHIERKHITFYDRWFAVRVPRE